MKVPEPLMRPCCEMAVTKTWSPRRPPVTVLVVTRNHESYIDYCIRGILAQVTSFPFSVLVYDAGSEDETLNLLNGFQSDFPNIITIFTDRHSGGSPLHPADVLLPKVETEIVFLCDGDDYWSDYGKIETQARLLSADTRLAGVYHRIIQQDMSSGAVADRFGIARYKDLNKRDLMRGAWVPTSTLAYKHFIDVENFSIVRQLTLYDVWLGTKLGMKGAIAFARDISPSVAHIHSGGAWSGLSGDDRVMTKAHDERLIAEYYANSGYKTESRIMMSRSIRTWASQAGGERIRIWVLMSSFVQEIREALAFLLRKPFQSR